MRLSNGFVIDKEKTFGELKFTAVRDVFLQNEDGTPSTQLKKRIYDLKCSLHGGIIPVSVPPEVPLREFPYNAVVELVNPVADTVSRTPYQSQRQAPCLPLFHRNASVCIRGGSPATEYETAHAYRLGAFQLRRNVFIYD